jgi:hypothetical protein
MGISKGQIPDRAAITLLTTIFQGVGYLFMMMVANVCYSLGPFAERFIAPRGIDKYRRVSYGLGFWFSVLLPFSVPALLACLLIVYPSQHR